MANLNTNFISWRWMLSSLSIITLLSFLVFFPGLSGDFEFDDTANIVHNSNLVIDELTTKNLYDAAIAGGIAGPLKRPISVATFILNRYFSGLDPFYMKLTNLLIHILNGFCLFILTTLLLNAYAKYRDTPLTNKFINLTALTITLLWTIHPLTVTTNLYIVQRMTSISAFFTILGLISYVVCRQKLDLKKAYLYLLVALLLIFGILSIFSKENGVLLPLFLLAIELSIFGFKFNNKLYRRIFIASYALILVIPLIAFFALIFVFPDWLNTGYAIRHFSLTERLLTEARVIWFYLFSIILPNISQMGIYHDDIVISQSLFTPFTTIASILGLVILLIVAIRKRNSLPILSFSILFFFAGHILESTILPLEIAHEHRNYLPMYGILFAMVFYIINFKSDNTSISLPIIFISIFVLFTSVSTFVRSSYWGDLLEHGLLEVRNHPNSGRAQYQAGRIYWKLALKNTEHKEEFFNHAKQHFELASKVTDYPNGAYFALIHLSFFSGQELEQQWLDDLRSDLKNKPIPPATINALQAMTLCQIENNCKLSIDQMLSIFNACLNNTSLTGNDKASTLSLFAMYIANLQDYNAAVKLLHEASDIAPKSLNFRLTLIDLLIKLNRFEEARNQILVAKSYDTTTGYSTRIRKKENMLVERERSVESLPDTNKKSDISTTL